MCVMSVSGPNAARAVSSSRRSTDRNSLSRPLGSSGLRRETPTTSQLAERNFSIAAIPSRPLAPVTSTLFGMTPIFFSVVGSVKLFLWPHLEDGQSIFADIARRGRACGPLSSQAARRRAAILGEEAHAEQALQACRRRARQ